MEGLPTMMHFPNQETADFLGGFDSSTSEEYLINIALVVFF